MPAHWVQTPIPLDIYSLNQHNKGVNLLAVLRIMDEV